MNEGLKEKFLHWFTIAVIAIVVFGGLAIAYRPWKRGQALKQQEAELRAQIEAKKAEIARLKENQQRFRTDADFVERIARQNRRVFPGELVFIFDN